jgi:hypothetical protein
VARVVDGLSILLLLMACAAFLYGLRSLTEREDLRALYNLAIGALMLKSAIDLLRSRGT